VVCDSTSTQVRVGMDAGIAAVSMGATATAVADKPETTDRRPGLRNAAGAVRAEDTGLLLVQGK
jgi:hypothetical protein